MKVHAKKLLFGLASALAATALLLAAVLAAPASVSVGASGEGLMVGVGIERITPTSDMYPMTWGSGNRGFVFVGALEHVYVRVIAVSNAGNDAAPANTSLIVSFETGKGPYPPDMIPLLSAETGVPAANIFWSTTHVHSTPEITTANWADSLNLTIRTDTEANELADLSARNKARWGAMLEKQLVAAAQAAIADMREAEVSLGTTNSYINVNRDTKYASNLVQNPFDPLGEKIPGTLEGYNGNGFSDRTLTVVEFRERAEGKKPIAFIVHYAMHNVLLYANDYFNPDYNAVHGVRVAEDADIEQGTYVPGNVDATVLSTKLELNVAYSKTYEKNFRDIVALDSSKNVDGLTAANAAIHPDIGGLVSQYVEKAYPGAVALWMSGAAGDQNPLFRNTMNFESPYTGGVLEIPIDGGKIEPAEYYAAIQFADVQRAIGGIDADAGAFQDDAPIGFAWGTDTVDPIDELYYGTDRTTGAPLDPVPYNKVPLFMTVMRLGDITLAGVPNEPYNAIGVAMRDESSLGGAPTKNTLVVDHCWTHAEENSYRGYYPDDVAIGNNSYQWGSAVKYPQGTINGAYTALLEKLWADAAPSR
jgi:hypothetical protein